MRHPTARRPARRTPAPPPVEVWTLERPPLIPSDEVGVSGMLSLAPFLAAGVSMAVMLSFRGSGLALVGASMMLLTILVSALLHVGHRGRAARNRRAQRAAYLSYLERTRSALLRAEAQRDPQLVRAQPPSRALPLLVRDRRRLWERRPGDADFLRVRLGSGTVRVLNLEHRGEHDPLRLPDDFMQAEMEQVQRRFECSLQAPVDIALPAGEVSVVGDRAFCEHVARLVLTQAACFASPNDLHLALVVPPQHRQRWAWASWLPHLGEPCSASSTGPRPRVAPSMTGLRDLMHEDLRRRIESTAPSDGVRADPGPSHLLVVCDELGRPAQHLPGQSPDRAAVAPSTTVVHLLTSVADEPPAVDVRVQQLEAQGADARLEYDDPGGSGVGRREVRLDEWGPAECAALARTLAGLRPPVDSPQHPAARASRDMVDLLGVGDTGTVDLDRLWAARGPEAFLRVPIGTDDSGDVVEVDLKEAAASGMGPHGLCVGATGSGKSELLRTLVLSLLSTHPPEDVAMVLVDYKGGATFAPFATAAHVHGVITNLDGDTVLIERVYASLAGEVRRRQEVLKAAGHLPDITAYRRRRAERIWAGEPLAPMPHLLVIVDEFGELLSARPDFIELFLSLGRIGRSIGVHLLLSSQRVEAGRLRGLETHLSYRIGLRTLSAAESRTVLDTDDAFSLPTRPGYGYLKVDSSVYRQFRAGLVSGSPRPLEPAQARDSALVQLAPFYGTAPNPADPSAAPRAGHTPWTTVAERGPGSDPSLLQTVMTALRGREGVGPPIWLPPLPEQLTLDQVPGGSGSGPGGVGPASSSVRVPLGLLDDPARQWQGRWELDLATTGNVLVVGGPRSGRSTLLRSLTASLALHHAPDQVVVYGVDATGSGLGALDALPCVAGVGCRPAPEVMRRALTDVHAVLAAREVGASMSEDQAQPGSQERMSAGVTSASRYPADVVVLVDGFGSLCEEHPEMVQAVHDLLRRGPAYGIRLVCTANRRHEVRMQAQAFFTTVIELRLTDLDDSGRGRTRSQLLLNAPPGRCLLPSGLVAQVALPRVDGQADRESADLGLAALVREVRATATRMVSRLRVLPATVTPEEIAHSARPGTVAIGLDEADFSTTHLELDGADRHLLIVGDSGTGKTSLLARVLHVLIEQHTVDELAIAQIDPRGVLRTQVPPEYLGGYAGSSALAHRLVQAVLPELDRRACELADRPAHGPAPSPRIVIAVDDYEAVTAGGKCPLHALIPYVAIAREIGVHVCLTRSAHGAARGAFEPVLSAVRENGATGLLFSGDRAEGPIFGSVRPQRLPTGRALVVRSGQEVRTVQTVYQPPGR